MADRTSVPELLMRWQEGRQEGQVVGPEELCADCPELVDELRRQVEAVMSMEAMLGTHEEQAAGFSPSLAATLTRSPETAPTALIPGYDILGELGRGGMGVVYRAVHRKLKRTVALKMILAGRHARRDQLARFRLEAEAIARLKHPHIVQIFEIGEEGGNPFFALEFVDGGSLDRFSGTPQPARLAAEMVAILARAIHVAHQAGVIHRDLKPGNILLARRAETGPTSAVSEAVDLPLSAFEPKITDFGLAKQLDAAEDLSHTGAIMGTPSYMAPEQADGRVRDIGPATDVYALAAVLYDLLTGRPPFKGATAWETVDQVRTQQPVPPSRLQPKVPRDLEIICLKGLRKDARQRYGSALELAEDLRRFLDGQPILARPISKSERAWKWARREPAKAAAVAAVVLALVAGALGTVFYGLYKDQQATTREQQANAREEQATALKRKLEKQEELRQKLDELRRSAEAAGAANRLEEAGKKWSEALVLLDNDPDQLHEGLRPLFQDGLAQVEQKLAEAKTKTGRKADQKDFADLLQRYGPLRDQVIFHSVSYGERDLSADTAIVRRAAPAALELLKLDVTKRPDEFARSLERFRSIVETPQQLDKLARECFQILLAWAAAEAAPGPGVVDTEASPRTALQLLDRAAALESAYKLQPTRVYHLRRARFHELLGEEARAEAERERAATIEHDHAARNEPTPTIDLFESALDHFRNKRTALAEADCQKVLQQEPTHYWAQYVASLCNMSEKPGKWDLAIVRLDVCLKEQPGSPLLRMHRAAALAGAGKLVAAERDFKLALDGASDDLTRATVLINRSIMWIHLDRLDDAADDLRKAIELHPKAYQGYVNLARVYELQRKPAEAVKAIDEALTRQPGIAAFYAVRARLQLTRGEHQEARQDFEEYLAREPKGSQDWAKGRVALADLKLKAGESASALADCDSLVQALPKFAPAHLQRAQVLLSLPDRHADAGQSLDRYLATGGKMTPKIHQARGLIHLRFKKPLEAVEAFSSALTLRKDAETYSLRGWAYLTMEAARPALADFEAALTLEKVHADALRGKATALFLQGRMLEGEDATEAALKQGQRTAELLLQVACIYGVAVGKCGIGNHSIHYVDRAVQLVHEAMKRTDASEQQAFWQDKVEKSPALIPLQGTSGMRQLARMYGSK